MAVRVSRRLVDDGRCVDLGLWRAHQLQGLPVGRHDECGGAVYAVEYGRGRRGLWWFGMRCRCGHEAALPGRPAPPARDGLAAAA